MRVRDYEKFVEKIWTSRRKEDESDAMRQKFIMTVGLGGECGEVLELLKKEVRNKKPLDTNDLSLELGDVLYYLTKIAHTYGITLNDLMERNKAKLEHRQKHGKSETQTGWLIEAQNELMGNQPMWLEALDPLRWTQNSHEAIRFSRKKDASDVMVDLDILSHRFCFVSEHQWS
jgi:NTP pyrophosphatase (non-canonical NTP hydrolase)